MLCFICRTLCSFRAVDFTCSSVPRLYFSQFFHSFSSSTPSSTSTLTKRKSFTISYLIEKCGFPPEKAQSASKYLSFENPQKPDSVLAFFQNHGFTSSQISQLTRRFPLVLLLNPEKNLLPKLEFFQSKGISRLDIVKILTVSPDILGRSLENQIIPVFSFFRRITNLDEVVIVAIKRFPGLLLCNFETLAVPKAAILKEAGVSDSNIAVLLKRQPRLVHMRNGRFAEIVECVKKMGFDPLEKNFVAAMRPLTGMSRLTWERKVEIYKKWGLSDEQHITAFRKHPSSMTVSEKKLMKVMDFFVNRMGWEPSFVAKNPVVVSLSLEKRIIPRSSIYNILVAKESGNFNLALISFLKLTEKRLVKLIKNCCKEEASELLKIYQAKLQDVSK